MKILSVGGGSGGHVTPVVAVLRELKSAYPDLAVRFWCDRRFAPEAKKIVAEYDPKIPVQTVWAGKFRRYRHLSKIQHLLVPSVVFLNLRDILIVFLGLGQSILRLLVWRPNVVFLKGGYVCLPVGWAAWLLRIPVVIHDSDAHPGLTNRMLAPIAKHITTGVSLDHYNYPAEKSSYVGIPIDAAYRQLSDKERIATKKSKGFDSKRPLTVFIGGGQGARPINDAVALHLNELLKMTNVVLVAGSSHYDELRSLTPQNDPRFRLEAFISQGLPELLGAADVVVTRAGATTLLELAAMARPTIVVPSKRLLWQVKQAKLYVDMHAVYPLDEDRLLDPKDKSLLAAVQRLLSESTLRNKLAHNIHRLARPDSAKELSRIIINASRKQ